MKSSTTNKKFIEVNGYKLKRDNDGEFVITPLQFGKHDLSTLPVGTKLYVNIRPPFRRADVAWVIGLRIPQNGGIVAKGLHFPGTNRGSNLISDDKYVAIAQKLFKDNAAVNRDLKVIDIGVGPFGGTVLFSLTVKAVAYADIQREVRDRVRTILQPLLDFQQDLSNESTRRFGI